MKLVFVVSFFALLFFNCSGGKKENIKQIQIELNNLISIQAFNSMMETKIGGDTLTIILWDTSSLFYTPFAELKSAYIFLSIYNYTKDFVVVSLIHKIINDKEYIKNYKTPEYRKWFKKSEMDTFINEAFLKNPKFESFSNYMLNNITLYDFLELDATNERNSKYLVGYEKTGSITDLVFEYASLDCATSDPMPSAYSKLRMIGLIKSADTSNVTTNFINYLMLSCNYPKLDPTEYPPFKPNDEYLDQFRNK